MAAKKTKVVIPAGQFGETIDELVCERGGYLNAHAHLDRSCTLEPKYLEHFGTTPLQATSSPLRVKQSLTGELHKGLAYNYHNLRDRIKNILDLMVETRTREVVSFIDATPDVGLHAINTAVELRDEYCDIDFKIAAHPIFGFKDDPQHGESRWDVFKRACGIADVIGALPERDDRPDSIGFDEHIRRVLLLGKELEKQVHIHVDQDNDPRQRHTLDLIEAVRWIGVPKIAGYNGPTVWAIHSISPAAYPEDKFRQVLYGLKKYNIGVICCPRAAISMRQNRAIKSPTHSSIARVLEMALAGIPVLIGTDNIADMFVPTSSGSMLNEIVHLADDLRFYNPQVLAKFAAGVPLNQSDLETIRRHLEQDVKAFKSADPNFEFCLPLD